MQTKSKQKAFFYGFTHLFSADLGWIGQNFKALKADLSKEFHAKSKALRLELDKDYQKKSNSSKELKAKKPADSTFISVNASIQALVNYSTEHQSKLIELAEKQTNHIIRIESELLDEQKKNQQALRELREFQLKEQITYSKRGQLFAFVLIVLGFAFALTSAVLGISWLAIAGVLAALGTIAAQFLGKKGKK